MTRSANLFDEAQQYIPGGVNSPVRAFKSVNQEPIFIERGAGPYLFDVDGKQYTDYVCSWGPLILGHCPEEVTQALAEQLQKGVSFGATTTLETTVAKEITQLMPSIEQVRFVNSGTEATMSAIRLARAYTKRDKFIKFEGCYHGHADCLLVNAGSGALTFGVPSSPGIPQDTTKQTLTAQFNDLASVKALFEASENKDQIAAIIVEPVAGNMNCVLPTPEFLPGLRTLCDQYGAVLIFDEVMTGFRIALGGAQAHYDVAPDLTTLGKVIGGGMPVGAFGGKRDIMALLAPSGPVYQAGTLSGNPMALTAGLTTLKAIQTPGFYQHLSDYSAALCSGLKERAQQAGVALQTTHLAGMFGLFFEPETFKIFHQRMLEGGVYLAPSAFEAGFVSSAHNEATLNQTLTAAESAFKVL